MSLENEIKLLTEAVNGLTALLSKQPVQLELDLASKSDIPIVSSPAEVPPPTPVSKAVTRNELQAHCLKLVRENTENKNKIIKLLAAYNAKVIADVPDDKLAELEAKLGKL